MAHEMKRLLILPFLLLSLLAGFPISSSADQLKDGTDAFARGDYETAFELLMPLAETGNTQAQLGITEVESIF